MRKLLLIFLSCGFLFLCASGAQATPIEVGDWVKFTSHGESVEGIGTAGEFTWTFDHDKNGAYDSKDYSWSSFCVELDEHVSQNVPYEVLGLTDYATNGGALSNETAWLFLNFTNQTLDGYVSGDGRSEQDLQALIWLYEDEIDLGIFQTYFNGYSNQVTLGNWMAQVSDAVTNGNWENYGQVKVVNFGAGIQDQLVVAPVPEPATMVLFGIGLLSLAGIGRKKIQK